MNQKYKLSKLAESDLTGIWRYTAETWSQDQANRYVKMIMDAFNEIAKAPAVLGRSYEHVRQGYSAFGVRNYGNNISPINKKILSDIAKEKGIKEYQMYIDLQSESYSMKFKKAK